MSSNESCRIRPWDSEFFGVQIAHVRGHALDTQKADEVLSWCRENDVDFVSFLANIETSDSTKVAETYGFHLVDLRLTFERSLTEYTSSQGLRRLTLSDLGGLQETAATAHLDSRFFTDGHFDRERCENLYKTWLQRSVEGEFDDIAMTVENGGEAEGYVTLRFRDEVGSIGLIAVAEGARGKGIGHKLVDGALRKAAEEGCKTMEVVTQGRNIHAQRLYQSHGFRTKSVEAWYHRWFDRE